MKKGKTSASIRSLVKPSLFAICFLLIVVSFATPLYGQLSAARDLTGTWSNAIPENYYVMDSFDPTMRMNDVSVTYSMIITQSGNSISIVLNINELSSVTDPAYLNEYGYGGVPIVGFNQIGFTGTISGASFSADEFGASSGNAEHIAGTFTSDIITATLTGNSETTDTKGIIVTRNGAPTSTPTFAPTQTPTATLPPTNSYDLGTVGLVRGAAWLKNSGAETQLTSNSQVGAGSQVRTGSDAQVKFTYPDSDSIVVLGSNTEVGWVGLQSHPAPDSTVTYTPLPADVTQAFDWGEEGRSLLGWTLAGATTEMVLTGAVSPYILGAELAVHGGIILVHYGQFYVKENGWPQLVQVPLGFIQGQKTEYSITVTNHTTTIQVIDGPLVFLDPVSSNSITVNTGEVLTLSATQQNGFSQQELQSDVSTYNSASSIHWWTQASANTSPTGFLTNPVMIAGIVVVIAVVIVVVLVIVMKRKKRQFAQPTMRNDSGMYPPPPPPPPTTAQTNAPMYKMASQSTTQPPTMACPNCQKQLAATPKFCPYCGYKFNAKRSGN